MTLKQGIAAFILGLSGFVFGLGVWLAYDDHHKVQQMWAFLSQPRSQQAIPTPVEPPKTSK